MLERARKRLGKKARRGFRGYPVATIAVYGPDDTTATKLTVGIVPGEHAEVSDLRRWFSAGADIRNDATVAQEVPAFIDAAGARSVIMTDRIIGCRHEEGVDYDEGQSCPNCPFWARRDRWTGNRIHQTKLPKPYLINAQRQSPVKKAGFRPLGVRPTAFDRRGEIAADA